MPKKQYTNAEKIAFYQKRIQDLQSPEDSNAKIIKLLEEMIRILKASGLR